MKSIQILISCVVIIVAGCSTVSPKSDFKHTSFDDPSRFEVYDYKQGAERAYSSFSGAFYVKQGVPFKYSVEAQGSAVRVTVIGGFKEKRILDQKAGSSFESTFVTEYTGLADFVIEVADQGRASGHVIPLTKIKE